MDKQDLNELRSIEELASYDKEVTAELARLNTEYAGQPFPEEVRESFADYTETHKEIGKRIVELEARNKVVLEAGQEQSRTVEPVEWKAASRKVESAERDIYDLSSLRGGFLDPERADKELTERAKRANELAVFPHEKVNREDAQARVDWLIDRDTSGEFKQRVLITGSPTYRRAFAKHLMGAQTTSEEQRALSLGTPRAVAGLAVPFVLDPTVIPISNGVVNPIRSISRVETITGSDEWRGITSTAITSQYRAEGAEVTDNSPTIAQPSVRAQRADAFVPFSREIGADWGSLVAELSRLLQESKDDLESVQFWSGAGTTVYPQGVFTGLSTTQRAAPATNGAFVVGDLYTLNSALPPRSRPRASYMASLTNLNRIRAFDTTGTLYTTLTADQPGQLMGRPAYENSAMPTAMTVNLAYVIYGDFSKYLILDRVGMEIEVIPHLFGTTANYPSGQRGLFAFWRNSAVVLDPNAFRYLASTA